MECLGAYCKGITVLIMKSLNCYLKKIDNYIVYMLAIGMAILSIVGSINVYSNIPLWDMWDSDVSFVFNFLDGNFSSLFD